MTRIERIGANNLLTRWLPENAANGIAFRIAPERGSQRLSAVAGHLNWAYDCLPIASGVVRVIFDFRRGGLGYVVSGRNVECEIAAGAAWQGKA